MSYTLRVLFSGPCALIPERPFDTGDPGSVTVLLPNLLKPREGFDPHFPIVSFDLADLYPQSSRKPDLRRGDSGRGACLLLGEDVSFALKFSEPQNSVLTILPALQGQSIEDSLASMGTPNSFVKQELLDLSRFTNHELCIARIHLTQGSLRASKMSERDYTSSPPVAGQDSIPQRIATELALDVEGVEGNVSILTSGRDGERSINLSPVRRSDLLEIWIQNIEFDDFLGIPKVLRNGAEMSDFEIYYQLAYSETNPRSRS